MTINDTYSITSLFADDSKTISIIVDKKQIFHLKLKTAREFITDSDWGYVYQLLSNKRMHKKIFPQATFSNNFEFICAILFGKFSAAISAKIQPQLQSVLPELEIIFPQKKMMVNNIEVNPEIWDYIINLLKLSCGNKKTNELAADNPRAQAFLQAQEEAQAKIAAIRKQSNKNSDGLMKMILHITYVFPSFTVDYLFNQTLAQIHWLYSYAGKSMSYEVQAMAYAAGNLKKNSKPEFFIK